MSAATNSPTAVARSSLRTLLRDAARLDRTQSDPLVSLRNAIGIAGPLAVGALAGNAGIGLASTVGAIQTAFADRPGPYRLRMLRMFGTAVVAATTSGLAVAASRTDAASTVLLLVLAFVAGLLVTAGPSATQVGTAAVAAALLLGHVPNSPSNAVHVGLLVLAGGAVQAVLAVAGWPLRRHRPERTALAALYRELAAAARLPRGTGAGPPAADTLTAVRQTFYGLGHDHGPSVEAYRVLLDEAERIRREIVVVAADRGTARRRRQPDPRRAGAAPRSPPRAVCWTRSPTRSPGPGRSTRACSTGRASSCGTPSSGSRTPRTRRASSPAGPRPPGCARCPASCAPRSRAPAPAPARAAAASPASRSARRC